MLFRLFLSLILLGLPACATVESPQAQPLLAQQTLIIPPGSIEHVVAKGETLWRISKLYHSDLEDIIRINRIPDSTTVTPGQKIYIPRQNSDSTAPTTNFSTGEDTDFLWPIRGKIITQFRQKSDGTSSKGIDILSDTPQDVLASRSGTVVFIGEMIGYGTTVILDHRDGFTTIYCGNESVSVHVGDTVKQGTTMAKTSTTPASGYGSLHF
jgi:murein DD-endopeptidase MepM/ murein hydrolase activator NlpD